jgi:hypothetical protein
MARVLKRPMFRRGGSTNDGIMSGLTEREQYSNAGKVGESARDYISQFEPILREFTPKTRLPLGAVGAALVQGTPIRDALTAGYTDFTRRDDKREAAIRSGAAQLGIGQALKDITPGKLLAAQRKAKILLDDDVATGKIKSYDQNDINSKTAELIKQENIGKTYSPQAVFEKLRGDYFSLYNDNDLARRHANYDTKVVPQLKEISRGRIKKDKSGKYKPRRGEGIYVDINDGKVIQFKSGEFIELPELSALL